MIGAGAVRPSSSPRLVSYVDHLTWVFVVPVDDEGFRSDLGEPTHLLVARATWDDARSARAWDLHAVVGIVGAEDGEEAEGDKGDKGDKGDAGADVVVEDGGAVDGGAVQGSAGEGGTPDAAGVAVEDALRDVVAALDARQVLSPAAATLVTTMPTVLVPALAGEAGVTLVRSVTLLAGFDPAAPTQAAVGAPFLTAEPAHIRPLLVRLQAVVDGPTSRGAAPPSPEPFATGPGGDQATAADGRRPWTVVNRLHERIAETLDARRRLGHAAYELNTTHQEIELARQNVQARLRDQEDELHRVERDTARLDAERAHFERARAEARQARLEADHEERELAAQEARLDRRAADLDEQEARIAARLEAIRHEQRQVAAATTVLRQAQRELVRADAALDEAPADASGASGEAAASVREARAAAAAAEEQLRQQAEKDGGQPTVGR